MEQFGRTAYILHYNASSFILRISVTVNLSCVFRGFRDVIDLITDKIIRAEMSHVLKRSKKQHRTQDANGSRLVTKVR